MVIFDRDCGEVIGEHYHRECRACGARWLERAPGVAAPSAGPAGRHRASALPPLERWHGRLEEDEHLGGTVEGELLYPRGDGAEARDWGRYPNRGRDRGRSVKASNIAQE